MHRRGRVPAGRVPPSVAFRVLSTSVLGVAMMRLSDRLGPDENADDLARDALDVAIAGLKSGVALRTPAPRARSTTTPCLARRRGRADGRPLTEEPFMYRAFISPSSSRSSPCSRHGGRGATGCNAADGKTSDAADAPSAVAVVPRGSRRAADRPLHPRHRQPDRRGPGGRRGRDRRARDRDAGRTGHAGGGGHGAGAPVATETEAQVTEAEANAAQIEARLGMTAGDASTSTRCPRCRRRGRRSTWPRASSSASSRCSSSGSSRSRSSTSAARRWRRRASSSSRQGTCAAQQYQALQAARARVDAGAGRRSPTRSSARPSPASSPSASSRSATT